MQPLEIALLGPPRITLDGKPIVTDRRKAIALLARLGAEPAPQTRENLAALLWPDYPQESAFSYLRRTLWELNQALGKGWIEADREHLALVRAPGMWLDLDEFRRAAASTAGQPDDLEAAARLYRGDFLEGLQVADTPPFETWQREAAGHFRREFAALLEKLVISYENAAQYELALPHARRWLGLDPIDEAACQAVMRQQAGLGDRSGVVRVYQALTQTLQAELGVDPQPETTGLYRSILLGNTPQPAISPPAQAPPPASTAPTSNLPVPPTPFIGRRSEVEQIITLTLQPGTRLLTLTGPGGAGKTRLSIQAAGEMAASFPDGVWFIPLAPLASLQGLVSTTAKALSVAFYREEERPRQQLLDFLREKHLLLILDNFEHMVEEGAALVAEILAAAPGVRILVTSRVRLNLQGEQVYRVTGMRIPDPAALAAWDDPTEQSKPFSAIQLLVERARRVRPDFQLTRHNLPAVAEICRLVEGSPLGIELAVTWLELLPPDEIAREISRSLDFLATSAPDIPARQRSLRAVFETSWNLLDETEQCAFRRLCIFQGSFTLQAARQVSAVDLRTLLGLANKSWLPQDENGRIQLHELLRQYGLERLKADPADWSATRDRHAAYYTEFLYENGIALRSASQLQALDAIRMELESNIPAAWEWMASHGRFATLVEKMLPGLFHYWLIRNTYLELIDLLKLARRAAPTGPDRTHILDHAILETVEVSFEMGWMVLDDHPAERLEKLWSRVHELSLEEEMGFWYMVLVATYRSALNFEEGSRRLFETWPLLTSRAGPWDLGYCYLLASESFTRENRHQAVQYQLKALAIFEQIGVTHEQGIALRILGFTASSSQDYLKAVEYTRKAQNKLEQAGDILGMGMIWTDLAEFSVSHGDIDQAFKEYERGRQFHEKNGNRRWLGQTLSWESMAASRYGRLDYALETRLRSLEIAREVGNQNDTAWHTWELGETYRLLGDFDQAAKYFHMVHPLFEKIQSDYGIGFVHRGYAEIAMARGDLEEARRQFELALSFQEKEQRILRIWGLAYTHARLGVLLVQLTELEAAWQHLRTGLQLAEEWVHADIKAVPLTGIAAYLAARGAYAAAIEIASCIASRPTTWHETRQQASTVLAAAEQAIHPDEARRARLQGEAAGIDALTLCYLGETGPLPSA